MNDEKLRTTLEPARPTDRLGARGRFARGTLLMAAIAGAAACDGGVEIEVPDAAIAIEDAALQRDDHAPDASPAPDASFTPDAAAAAADAGIPEDSGVEEPPCALTDRMPSGQPTGAPDAFCDVDANRNRYLNAPGSTTIRVNLVVVQDATGLSATPAQQVAMLASANAFLSTARLRIVQVGATTVLADPTGQWGSVSFGSAAVTTLVAGRVTDALNVYLVGSVVGGCGFANDIGLSAQGNFIVMETACGGDTLAHEVGHLLGLFHTHHQPSDFCADTPADPGPPAALPEGTGLCNNPAAPQCMAVCADGSNPSTTNVMSYYSCADNAAVGAFTAEQAARARCYADRNYASAIILVPGCTPQLETCNGADDDCDGSVDEGCVPPACIPRPEVCNGVDDDCDGSVDEVACPSSLQVVHDYVQLQPNSRATVTLARPTGFTSCVPLVAWEQVIEHGDDQCDFRSQVSLGATTQFTLIAEHCGLGHYRATHAARAHVALLCSPQPGDVEYRYLSNTSVTNDGFNFSPTGATIVSWCALASLDGQGDVDTGAQCAASRSGTTIQARITQGCGNNTFYAARLYGIAARSDTYARLVPFRAPANGTLNTVAHSFPASAGPDRVAFVMPDHIDTGCDDHGSFESSCTTVRGQITCRTRAYGSIRSYSGNVLYLAGTWP